MDRILSKISFGFFLVLTIFVGHSVFFPSMSFASVGQINMRSTNTEDYRCYASSLLIPNGRYDVAINCVNLIFPINPDQISTYIVWATPINGKNPIKLGDLQKGVVRFEPQGAFSEIYVTWESNGNTRAPSTNNIVMRGVVEPIPFLEVEQSPTPTPEPQAEEEGGETQEEPKQLSTRDKLFLALRRAGIAAVVALVAIVGLVFVVTRSRG